MKRCEIFADIGINHNGSVETACKLADVAKIAGCDAVKLQVRTPDKVVPPEYRDLPYTTPWGVVMPYIEYRRRIELGLDALCVFHQHCKKIGIEWFASAWDMDSWERLLVFKHTRVKIASAMMCHKPLLDVALASDAHVYMSTGMHERWEVDLMVACLKRAEGIRGRVTLMHCNSAYPARNEDINLLNITTMRDRYGLPVGYSGHERGLQITYAAVALGATAIERHITLDRTQTGSDHAASVEPSGLIRMVRDIRAIEDAMGGPERVVTAAERKVRDKLRWYRT